MAHKVVSGNGSPPPETPPPNSLIPVGDAALLVRLAEYAEHARGAFAPATEQALRSDTGIFATWCRDAGLASLPAAPATLVRFIDERAEQRSPATVRRYVSSIATMHKAAGVPNPAVAPEVGLALKRMHRVKGRAQKQAVALTRRHVDRMLRKSPSSLRGLRDRALLATAYDTLARRSELAAMELADFALADDGGDGTVIIRRSKTDQEGRGQVRFVSRDSMERLTAWVSAAAIEGGPVFRSVLKGGRVGKPLGAPEVARIFRGMARAAGLPEDIADRVSAHSSRVGAASDMVAHGLQLLEVMQAGGWKSAEMVAQYTAGLEARRGAAAKLAKAQRR